MRIAGLVAAEDAGIGVGDVVADRTVGHALFDVAYRVDQTIGQLARRAEEMKGEPLRAFRADAGQALQFFDESYKRIRQGHQSPNHEVAESYIPGILSPPIMPPIVFDISSSALRCASLTAARIRSCNISTSSFETTSGSILIDCSCFAPLTTTVTMPPPAVASTRISAICFCRRSCICCACFIICWMFMDVRFYISSTSRISA